MGRLIKKFPNGAFLEYDNGSFDSWCIYYVSGALRKAPKDAKYFERLAQLGKTYGVKRVYGDFVWLYQRTGKAVDGRVLESISRMAASYDGDALAADVVFSILYLGMIAEENKRNTRLGKRIKRLGVHLLLQDGYPAEEAAGYLTGMRAKDIAALCEARGF